MMEIYFLSKDFEVMIFDLFFLPFAHRLLTIEILGNFLRP